MSDANTCSPSLLDKLQKYKFSKFSQPSPVSNSLNLDVIEIPETSTETSQGSSLSEESSVAPPLKKTKVPVISESDDSDHNESAPSKSQVISEKEHMFRNMALLHPDKDAIVIQNTLSSTGWDVEKTHHILSGKLPSQVNDKEKCQSAAVKKMSGITAHLQKFSYTKRRRAHCASSDDDDETNSESHKKSSFNNNAKKKMKFQNPEFLALSDEENDYQQDENDLDSEDSDVEVSESVQMSVLKFVQNATLEELQGIQGCSKKKAEVIIDNRPYNSWRDLTTKFETVKTLSRDILAKVRELLHTRQVVNKLMANCQAISDRIGRQVAALQDHQSIVHQPQSLNASLQLKPYQMLGLNWLALLHEQGINGILADEMGLGKTVQAIAFLAHLKQIGASDKPHLIVVPSSTLDNWLRELESWYPSANILCYYGSQEERKEIRFQFYNKEIEDFDIMLSTYNIVSSSPEDRNFFKKLQFYYVIYDEGHMLKNMKSQRYQSLIRIRSNHRLLLTGTPLQNNLVELMSLLIFIMPHLFNNKVDQIRVMFSAPGVKGQETKSSYEQKRISQAKLIMKPFVLRRLKSEVLKQLPKKVEEIKLIPMTSSQQSFYNELVTQLSAEYNNTTKEDNHQGSLMKLRKAANHPLLFRRHYTDDALRELAQLILKEPNYSICDPNLVYEDMELMSDFELHRLCTANPSISSFQLPPDLIGDSGKFVELDKMLPEIKERGEKVLLFSQFTLVLDIIQEYMKLRRYNFLRLDGQTPVAERQSLIDEFSGNPDLFVFLLSTKAGGLGINLTSANTVIIHDIDFNPYNDKQAEDRCHRVGQTKDVNIIRFISKGTIEEGMHACAEEKLRLERHITKEGEEDITANVKKLLKTALHLT